MKTLKKNLFIPFVLGIMLSVIIACNDESGSGTALTLSSYEGKVKLVIWLLYKYHYLIRKVFLK